MSVVISVFPHLHVNFVEMRGWRIHYFKVKGENESRLVLPGLESEAKADVPKTCILSNDKQGATPLVIKWKHEGLKWDDVRTWIPPNVTIFRNVRGKDLVILTGRSSHNILEKPKVTGNNIRGLYQQNKCMLIQTNFHILSHWPEV